MVEAVAVLPNRRADILRHYRHPWVFSQGVTNKQELDDVSVVRVASEKDEHLGWAFFHPTNAICLRMISFERDPMTENAWRERIQRTLHMRRTLLGDRVEGFRLIHGENDLFPGLKVDLYRDLLVMQVMSTGMERQREQMATWLAEICDARAVYERSEGHARKQEGLAPFQGFVLGEADFPAAFREYDLTFTVNPTAAHKTAFYLDHRNQRDWLRQRSAGKRVLDVCSFTGGFTLAALQGGAAMVHSVDQSQEYLDVLAEHLALNKLDPARQKSTCTDMFDLLKNKPDEAYDFVVLDMPSLARSARAKPSALRTYRKLHQLVCAWLKPGGILLTFSCSKVVDRSDFRQSIFLGLRDCNREGLLIETFDSGADHPIHLQFPEGEYLKGYAIYLK
ncbi:class I SAM-dependent rRNA methyltransferase [Acanthopleuribacter pedis]|uniref:Class I SAM-dependent rRNA methyltransferase n=1 Tax=Acanthopleuribacter pedis TaxID=442870 RepID=A0A8J7U4S1_9BACT|nr:class I SAM-dependent rRNA methyltransferase [Acanthopleuribacter pedis]MBO1320084.1 class I SAM-dependent rRNA methyltransferase [Acanthopleuribacter pedis]